MVLTSLASSRVNLGRVTGRARGPSVAVAAAAAAVTLTTSGSVMFVACEVSMAEESKSEDGSGEAVCRCCSGAVEDLQLLAG